MQVHFTHGGTGTDSDGTYEGKANFLVQIVAIAASWQTCWVTTNYITDVWEGLRMRLICEYSSATTKVYIIISLTCTKYYVFTQKSSNLLTATPVMNKLAV